MGQAIGAIGHGLGSMVNAGSDMVQGTGQSVSELARMGYSPADIAEMGGGAPSTGVRVARGLMRSAGQGLQQAGQQQRPQGGGYVPQIDESSPQLPVFSPLRRPDDGYFYGGS